MYSLLEELSFPRNRTLPGTMERFESLVCAGLAGWEIERQPVRDGANLIARRGSPSLVFGAHYDTLSGTPGADDNTASVAALLSLASRLPAGELAFFDFEEVDLGGSRAYVGSRPTLPAVILETVAYSAPVQRVPEGFELIYPEAHEWLAARSFRGDFLAVLYRSSSFSLASAFAACYGEDCLLLQDARELGVPGELGRQFSRSDHEAFWEADRPAIMVTDTANWRNPHYHQPSDLPATLDLGQLERVIEACCKLSEWP